MVEDSKNTPKFALRFSVRDLMVATAGVAVGIFVLRWKGWDQDERVVLAIWMNVTATGLLYFHFGGRRHLLATAIAASLLPAFGFWGYHFLLLAIWHMVVNSAERFMVATYSCITLSGLLAYVLALGSYCAIAFLSRTRVRMLTATCAACVGVAILAGAYLRAYNGAWHPIMTVTVPLDPVGYALYPPFAISDDGALLAVGQATPEGTLPIDRDVFLWRVRAGNRKLLRTFKSQAPRALAFSPDGEMLAVIHRNGVSFYETSTGELVHAATIPTDHSWLTRNYRFSPDGKHFVLCSAVLNAHTSNHVHTISVLETKTWQVIRKWNPTRVMAPEVARDQIAFLAFMPAVAGASKELTLFAENGNRPLYRQQNFYDVQMPFLSPDGGHLASGRRLLNLETGQEEVMPAHVICFASNGRRFVTRRYDLVWNYVSTIPYWQMAVPILRRWCHASQTGQAVLLDVVRKKEVCSSPNYPHEAFSDFVCSGDGKTVVGRSFNGTFRIWRVPD